MTNDRHASEVPNGPSGLCRSCGTRVIGWDFHDCNGTPRKGAVLVTAEGQHANVGAGGGDEDGYNVVDGREAMATRAFIVRWLRNKERFRPGTGWACNEEIASLIESGDGGELPWGRDDA